MNKLQMRKKRAKRVRAKVKGTTLFPRLCVFRSNHYIYAQIIDDEKNATLAAFDSRELKNSKNDIEAARKTGEEIAKIAKAKKVEQVVFDRKGYKYHGKVKALAEGARKEGLKF
ncbi:MAG: 50S ribosomal protein L18 [Parcubacteria group bacterium]|jgi:large subunit ribosomal protein L18